MPADRPSAPRPPATPGADRIWYCKIGGQTIGPVTAEDIRAAYAKGQINRDASVGIRGKKDWFSIRSLPEFADLVTGVGPRPGRARPAAAPPIVGIPSTSRDDETELVQPLAPPVPGPGGIHSNPQLELWQDEVRRIRRVAWVLGALAGLLFLGCIALLGLYLSG